MNMDDFNKDIDDLIAQFTQDESKTLADMKRVWISKKFSYIYEASEFFLGYLVSNGSLSHSLGGLYCLYCLYETQPFKPPFKANDIGVVPALGKRMLDRNTFLFGAVDLAESSVTETVNQLEQIQKSRIQAAYEKDWK